MVVTPSGITIDVILLGHLNKVLLLDLKRTPCDLSFDISAEYRLTTLHSSGKALASTLQLRGIVTLVKLRHIENASRPIVVTQEGMVTLVKFVQPLNAPLPMVVTPS